MTLEVNKKYKLYYTKDFCHYYSYKGSEQLKNGQEAIFIGELELDMDKRNIFYVYNGEKSGYIMFAADNVEEYCKEIDDNSKVLSKIEKLEKELQELRESI